MRYLLTSFLSLIVATASNAATVVMEGIASSRGTILISTNSARVLIDTNTYVGGISGVGVFTSSNVVLSDTAAGNKVVIYASGTINAANFAGNGSGITGIIPDYSTITVAIATKVSKAGDTMTGDLSGKSVLLSGGVSAATGTYSGVLASNSLNVTNTVSASSGDYTGYMKASVWELAGSNPFSFATVSFDDSNIRLNYPLLLATNAFINLQGPSSYINVPSSITGSGFFGVFKGDGSGVTGVTAATNANLTGPVTSVGNATTITAAAVDTAKIATDAVITVKILNGAVDTAKLGIAAVTTIKVAVSAIDTNKLATDSVITSKLINLAVDTSKLASDAVDTGKIRSDAVITTKILNLNVTTAKIAALAIDTTKISPGAVDTGKILTSAVTNDKIAPNAVDTTKIAAGSIDTNKLAVDSIIGLKILNGTIDTAKLNATIQAQLAAAGAGGGGETNTYASSKTLSGGLLVSTITTNGQSLIISTAATIAAAKNGRYSYFDGYGQMRMEDSYGQFVNISTAFVTAVQQAGALDFAYLQTVGINGNQDAPETSYAYWTSSAASNLVIGRTRLGAIAGPSVILRISSGTISHPHAFDSINNDTSLGSFSVQTSSNNELSGTVVSIAARTDGAWQTNPAQGVVSFPTRLAFSVWNNKLAAPLSAMTLSSSGTLHIGVTPSGGTPVGVSGTLSDTAGASIVAQGAGVFGQRTSQYILGMVVGASSGTSSNQFAGINSSGVQDFVVNETGLVGIGTVAPCSTCNIHVVGNGNFTGSLRQGAVVSCTTGVQTDSDGKISACVVSDKKLKTKIKKAIYSSKIDRLTTYTYDWKDKQLRDSKRHLGFIAQEVEQLYPMAVVPAGKDIKGLDSNALIAVLVQEIQDLRKRVKFLENK